MANEKKPSPARWLLRILSILVLLALAVIVAAVAGLFVYEPSPAEGFGFSSAGKTIRLSDGRTLAYLETGDPEGQPLFHFHGGPGSRLEGLLFDELNRRLGIRMIVPDRPGYGLSDSQEDRTYLDWPFELEDIHAPKVLVFHGEEDAGVDPRVAHYVCGPPPKEDPCGGNVTSLARPRRSSSPWSVGV